MKQVLFRWFLVFLIATIVYILNITSASKMYVEVPSDLVYNCSFDIKVMIDTQWEDIMWAAMNFDLSDWLQLEWLSFGEMFNMTYPINEYWNNIKAYAFYFPWVISWVYEFATIRLQQDNNWINESNLNFLFKWSEDTTDNMDVYPFGWWDLLTEVDDVSFVFREWLCKFDIPDLINDVTSTEFDSAAHMSSLENMISGFKKDQQVSLWSIDQLMKYKYYAFVLVLFIVLLIVFVIVRKKKKEKKKVNKKN